KDHTQHQEQGYDSVFHSVSPMSIHAFSAGISFIDYILTEPLLQSETGKNPHFVTFPKSEKNICST
ncbi:MAG: hypothetical protein IK090_06920, partial [Clostridia bacterium]|nr:hypothetical protein [Clostridia bacterium]